MILLLAWMASACPKQVRCLQVPVHTRMGEIPLDVQVWFPEYEKKTEPLYFVVGGPGQSGVEVAGYIAPLLRSLNRSVVFFSPLGTQSNDWFPCDTQTPTLSALFDDVTTSRACLPNKGFLVDELGSMHVARHLHTIRETLGHEKMILLGSSYGTRVAQLYVQEYPSTVHQLILDSGIPLDAYIGVSSFAEDVLNERLGEAGKKSIDTIVQSLPARIQTYDPSLREVVWISIDKDDFFLILHRWVYQASDQERLNTILKQVVKGDWEGFLQIAKEALLDNYSLGTYLSVFCQEDLDGLCTKEANARFPFCAHMSKQCAIWPKPSQSSSWTLKEWDIPTLIVHGRFDHVSPPAYAKRIEQQASQSTRVEFLSEAHGVSLTKCARDVIRTFTSQKKIDANQLSCENKVRIESRTITD